MIFFKDTYEPARQTTPGFSGIYGADYKKILRVKLLDVVGNRLI